MSVICLAFYAGATVVALALLGYELRAIWRLR